MRQTKLIEFRKAKGLTQEKMAQKLSVTVSLYQSVEQGAAGVTRKFMCKLKNAFPEACIDDLFFS